MRNININDITLAQDIILTNKMGITFGFGSGSGSNFWILIISDQYPTLTHP